MFDIEDKTSITTARAAAATAPPMTQPVAVADNVTAIRTVIKTADTAPEALPIIVSVNRPLAISNSLAASAALPILISDEDSNFKGKCLTVALNGSVGETFFQFDDFITSGDNAVLTLKNKYNPYLLIYIASMIRNHKWRYNYYRKLNLTKLKKMTIPLPFKNEKELDLEYIENIVKNSYGFDELKKYL